MHKLRHLLSRLAFGPSTKSWSKRAALPEASWGPKLKDESQPAPEYFDVADSAIKGLFLGIGELGKMEQKELDRAEKQQLRRQSREDLRNLNLRWLEEMTLSLSG